MTIVDTILKIFGALIFVIIAICISLALFTPRKVREWYIRRRFGILTVITDTEVSVKNVIHDYHSVRIVAGKAANGQTVYVKDDARQAKNGLGTIHTFTPLSEEDAQNLLSSSSRLRSS